MVKNMRWGTTGAGLKVGTWDAHTMDQHQKRTVCGTVILGDSIKHPIMRGVKFIHQVTPYGSYPEVSAGSHAHTKIVVGRQVGSGGG